MSNRVIKIPPFGALEEIEVKNFDYPDLNIQLFGDGEEVFIERVHAKGLETFATADTKVVMLVDEEGLLKGLVYNARASLLYGEQVHGQPITGSAYIVFEQRDPIEGDTWSGLPNEVTIEELGRAIRIAHEDPWIFQ